MKLPILLSVPHAGLRVPLEVKGLNLLTADEIAADGDGGAREIYALEDRVEAFVTTEIGRAFVDMNRAEDDRRKDGIVKTHTCWDVPIYSEPLDDATVERLIERYHRPYHRALASSANARVILGVDGHTMAERGPPVGPDAGSERPAICLGNGEGTCPDTWLNELAECFEASFGRPVSRNVPFRGGYIVRAHAKELPWVQIELSRAAYTTVDDKRARVLAALTRWCDLHVGDR